MEHDHIDDYYRDKELVEIETLRKSGHKKWGWIVYRTTYGDDEKWARFEERFQEQVRKPALDLDHGKPIHTQYLDFPVRSDIKYNNATAAQLRANLQEWRDGGGALQEQEMISNEEVMIRNILETNRYKYFIRVDAEAMESVLEDDEGWVDLVKVNWPEDDDDAREIATDDGHPPLEGITTYKVGFQRVHVYLLYPFCWSDLLANDDLFGMTRPPEISYNDF
jgi:hypothetical protein